MCQFLSAIVTRQGKVLRHDATDSHEILIRYFKLRDNGMQHFVRVEFRPDDNADLARPEKYKLRLDEREAPSWWDAAMQVDVDAELRGAVEAMIISDERDLLLDGVWILADGAIVRNVCGYARVQAVSGSAMIGYVSGSAMIGYVSGSAMIGYVSDSAMIGYVSGSAKIDSVSGSAMIGTVSGSAKIVNDKRQQPATV